MRVAIQVTKVGIRVIERVAIKVMVMSHSVLWIFAQGMWIDGVRLPKFEISNVRSEQLESTSPYSPQETDIILYRKLHAYFGGQQ